MTIKSRLYPNFIIAVIALLVIAATPALADYTIDIELSPGENFISLPVTPVYPEIALVTASIEGQFDSIWSYQQGKWKSYKPDSPDFSDLQTMEAGYAYRIEMNTAGILTITASGPEVVSDDVHLSAGQNFVGFRGTTEMDMQTALSSIDGFYSSVSSYENGVWKEYNPDDPYNSDLLVMKPGRGYMITTVAECVWALPVMKKGKLQVAVKTGAGKKSARRSARSVPKDKDKDNGNSENSNNGNNGNNGNDDKENNGNSGNNNENNGNNGNSDKDKDNGNSGKKDGGDITEIWLDVQEVRVKNESGGWQTVVSPVRFDLLESGNEITQLADISLPEGNIKELRLVLGENNQVKADGELYSLKVPSGQQSGLKLKGDWPVEVCNLTKIVIDFDLDKNINYNQGQGYVLKPVLKVESVTIDLCDENEDMDGDGFTGNDGDCDDTNADIYPGADEKCGDEIDQDCDGIDLICEDALILLAKKFEDSNLKIVSNPETGNTSFLISEKGYSIAQPETLPLDASPEEAARSFLSVYGSEFGLMNQAEELSVMKINYVSRGRTFIRFQQKYNGIPILGAELIVQMDAAKNVMSVNGETLSDVGVNTTPIFSAEEAAVIAKEKVASLYELSVDELTNTEPELWIYNPMILGFIEGQYFLTWHMDVFAGDVDEFVLVDANTNMVALNFNKVNNELNREIRHGQNDNNPDNDNVLRQEGQIATGDPDCDNTYDFIEDTYNFYMNQHGRDSIDDAGMQIVAIVHHGTNNAAWSVFFQQIWFRNNWVGDDIVAHEITHGVTSHTSHLIYLNQSGAINESFSDIWGEFVDIENGINAGEVRWDHGEDSPGGANRNLQNPSQNPFNDPDRMTSINYFCGTEDSGGVHTNSGVGNKAAYLMTDGGVFNGYTVLGLGISKVANLFYEVQINLLTSAADYADLYNTLLLGCNNLGYEENDCQQVRNALDATEMFLDPCLGLDSITVVSPNGGERYVKGEEHPIRWYRGNAERVTVELYKKETRILTIIKDTRNSSAYWTLPESINSGDDYRIRVTDSSGSIDDYSDAYFSISEQSEKPVVESVSPLKVTYDPAEPTIFTIHGSNLPDTIDYLISPQCFNFIDMGGSSEDRQFQCILDSIGYNKFIIMDQTGGNVLFSFTVEVCTFNNITIPIYRMYNNNESYHEHLYTANPDEVSYPWKNEGIKFHVFQDWFDGALPVYRLRKDGTPRLRLLAMTDEEKEAAQNAGYVFEQNLGYIYSSSSSESNPIYRIYKSSVGDRLYTTNWAEAAELVGNQGYVWENNVNPIGYAPVLSTP